MWIASYIGKEQKKPTDARKRSQTNLVQSDVQIHRRKKRKEHSHGRAEKLHGTNQALEEACYGYQTGGRH